MYNSDQFILQVKKKISLVEGRFDDQDILDFQTIALISDLVPELIKAREEFYIKDTTESVAQGSTLRLPSRAFGGLVREIKLVVDGKFHDLNRSDEEYVYDPTIQGRPAEFVLRGNQIVFLPSPDRAYGVFITYWLNPPQIVPVAECARVTAINGATITCVTPTAWTASSLYDIVKGTSDYEPVSINQAITSVTSNSIVFNTAPSSSSIEIGDYICLAGQSPYAYLQSAYYPVLLQYTVSLIHESLGDLEQKGASDAKAEAMLARLKGVFVDRTQGAPIKITSPW